MNFANENQRAQFCVKKCPMSITNYYVVKKLQSTEGITNIIDCDKERVD